MMSRKEVIKDEQKNEIFYSVTCIKKLTKILEWLARIRFNGWEGHSMIYNIMGMLNQKFNFRILYWGSSSNSSKSKISGIVFRLVWRIFREVIYEYMLPTFSSVRDYKEYCPKIEVNLNNHVEEIQRSFFKILG